MDKYVNMTGAINNMQDAEQDPEEDRFRLGLGVFTFRGCAISSSLGAPF